MASDYRVICASSVLLAIVAMLVPCPAMSADNDSGDAEFLKPILNLTLEQERRGVDVPWSNSATGRSGSIRVERTYYRGQQPCRDYVRTTTGASTEVHGTGCRIGKGKWEISESRPEASKGPSGSSIATTGLAGGSSDPPASATAPATAAAKSAADPPRPARKPAPFAFTMPTRSDL
jgi:hypothetical protein